MIPSLIASIMAIITKAVPDADKQAQINKEITELTTSVIKAESLSESWLTRTWRPWLMFAMGNFVILWGVHNCLLKPYLMYLYKINIPEVALPPEFWNLLALGFGVYGGARSLEKMLMYFMEKRR